MCEVKRECSVKGAYWVQSALPSNGANLIACGRHLPAAIKRMPSEAPSGYFGAHVAVRVRETITVNGAEREVWR